MRSRKLSGKTISYPSVFAVVRLVGERGSVSCLVSTVAYFYISSPALGNADKKLSGVGGSEFFTVIGD